ncbi:hypothetical protein Droror1_Dr00010737 [Drosera rotundifolia]
MSYQIAQFVEAAPSCFSHLQLPPKSSDIEPFSLHQVEPRGFNGFEFIEHPNAVKPPRAAWVRVPSRLRVLPRLGSHWIEPRHLSFAEFLQWAELRPFSEIPPS